MRREYLKKIFYFKNQRGAIILEYVLLLVACVAFAQILIGIVDRDNDPQNSGAVFKMWHGVLHTIGEDTE